MMTSLLALLGSEGSLALDMGALARGPRSAAGGTERRAGAVAVIPLAGPLMPRSRETWYGTIRGMDSFRASLAAAVGNADISAIVLDVESPGGTVAGTIESAAAVRGAAAVKPVVAVANSFAASAAYWIASQATQLVVTPGGEVGSIGVLIGHQDYSAMYDRMGVRTTIVTADDSPFKAERSPYAALSEAALADMKAGVNASMAAFIADVAAGRRTSADTVKAKFGGGRMIDAADAVRAGMADRVATLDSVIAELLQGDRPRLPRARADVFAFV